MQVSIKDFNVEMKIKNKGVELEIHDNEDRHLGDLIVNKTKVIWCKGRTRPANGVAITWPKFIEMMESR